MSALILWYAEPGVAMRAVLGVTLLERAVRTAQRAGLTRISVRLPDAEAEAARAFLSSSAVTADWHVFPDAARPTSAMTDGPTILIRGDRVFLPAALTALGDGEGELVHEGARSGVMRSRGLAGADLDALAPAPIEAPRTWAAVGASAADAERLLIKSLTKAADGVISRNINRKISGAITRRLAPLPVHPNLVTLVVAIIGVASGPIAAHGSYAAIALGGFLYYFSAILDGVDGEISRLKFLSSKLGAWLDTITDDVVCAAYLIGLYAGLATRAGHWHWVGWSTVGAFLATVLPRYYLMVAAVGAGDHQQIAAARKAGEKGWFGKAVDVAAETVFRTDFLPWFAFMTALLAVPEFFGYAFAVGALMAVVETGYTVKKVLAAREG